MIARSPTAISMDEDYLICVIAHDSSSIFREDVKEMVPLFPMSFTYQDVTTNGAQTIYFQY